MSVTSHDAPSSSPSQIHACIVTRSTMPAYWASEPIGSWMTATLALWRSLIEASAPKKSAPVRSILLMKHMRGTWYLSA